jgi:hypothetical protein
MLVGDYRHIQSQHWLSPADPSSNYNIARETYHEGTATWCIQGTAFREWEVRGSLLWIHGKRMFIPKFRIRHSLIVSMLCSGLREEHPLVRIALALLVPVHQHTN